jgi:hypothetical protein
VEVEQHEPVGNYGGLGQKTVVMRCVDVAF